MACLGRRNRGRRNDPCWPRVRAGPVRRSGPMWLLRAPRSLVDLSPRSRRAFRLRMGRGSCPGLSDRTSVRSLRFPTRGERLPIFGFRADSNRPTERRRTSMRNRTLGLLNTRQIQPDQSRRPRRLAMEEFEARWVPAVTFTQTNLVSDVAGMAQRTDPNLVNPWGMALGTNSGLWVAENGAGMAESLDGTGQAIQSAVTIPAP